MVNIIKLPNFFPGPKILYTKSSNIGDALMSLTTLRTWTLKNSINLHKLKKKMIKFFSIHLKVSEARKITKGNNVNGSSNGEKKFKFMNWMLIITSKAQAPNFKESFQIEKNCEGNLDIIISSIISVSWSLVMFKIHCCCCDAIRKDNAHNDHSKLRGTQNCVTKWRCHSPMFILIKCYQFPSILVPRQDLKIFFFLIQKLFYF